MKKLLHRPVQEFFQRRFEAATDTLFAVARFESACKTMAASLFQRRIDAATNTHIA